MFKVVAESSFRKDLKKYKKEKHLKEAAYQAYLNTLEDPGSGIPYVANMKGLRKQVVEYGQSEYRLIYRLYECCGHFDSLEETCTFGPNEEGMEACSGAVQFLFFRSREECNNLYKKGRSFFGDSEHPVTII
jgi:mRNA-degrading endonuclease RelE of RelBE toxin-antitoxin system